MTASHTPDEPDVPGAAPMFSVSPRRVPTPVDPTPALAPTAGPNPDFPNNAAPGTPPPLPGVAGRAPITEAPPNDPASADGAAALAAVTAVPMVAPRPAPSHGLAVARANDGLPMVLDPYAVASRAVLVLIGSIEPAKHIARTAIEMSIEHDSSAAIDVVIPRAIDLVLRRAAHLVSIGAGPKVVDHYTERLELWRRLARRSGLEPAAIVLTLAPFPIPTVASMLRVSLAEVEACLDDWYAGIDPDDDRPRSLTTATVHVPEQVIDLRGRSGEHAGARPAGAASASPARVQVGRRGALARWRLRQA